MSLKAVRLESGSGLMATFVPEAGMIGISLRSEGQELLGQRGGIESYIESGKTMGMPILYPWANRLAGDSYEVDGESVVLGPDTYGVRRDGNGLPIHGTLAASPFWEVEDASTGGDLDWAGIKASLDFGAHPELLASFPFPHLLEVEITLAGNALSVTTTVTPTGDLPVPLAFGFHPYISLPGTDRMDWTIDLPEMTALAIDERGIPTGQTRPFEAITKKLGTEAWDHGFSGLEDGATFAVADRDWLVRVHLETGYPAAQVFAPPAENVICFEPMKAPGNALVSGDGLKSVGPGSSDVSRFTISVSPIAKSPEPGPEAATPGRFRLEPEAPVNEIRRVAHDRARSAITSLRESAPENRASAIHETRKDIKKMRAVLRLVRDDIGKSTFRSENRRYRDAARLLSGARDTDVLIETVESLQAAYPDEAVPLQGLLDELETERDDGANLDSEAANRMSEAAAAIEAGGNLIDSWQLAESDWELFERGLRRTYRDGRRALATAEADPVAETVHEWRKRVKDLWYQLRLLRNAWRSTLKAYAKETGELAELLGRYNDLAVLIEKLDDRPAGDRQFPELRALAEAEQAALLEKAFPLGHRIYAEDPKAFAGRIGGYWNS